MSVQNNGETTKDKLIGGITGKGFMPGQSGNPGGRPKGGLKDYDRKKFLEMSDKDKEKFLKTISPELRYRMAEGNPKEEKEISGKLSISQILDELDGSTTKEQRVEDKPPLQDNK